MKLYEIDQALEEALNKTVVNEETGEVIVMPDFELIEQLQMERDKKIENVCRFVKNATSEAKAIADEIKQFTARKKVLENQVDRAKSFVEFALAGEKFESPTVSVTYRTSKSIVVDDMGALPEEFIRYKEPEADKMAIKAALKAGETVPGAHEEETKSIQIK